ncbi:MAG TPA: sulfite exporter TauE/SafE family protein [Segeticoccus sp.]|uniref:sulfite exporter TauE/SafE family protein n=1 Tax=Segeticoccus sp. TaxID=2706531 RepID=UPI002D80C20C|nr:sulfite exporter TauE/SafE family protein [Segeticoccus sp.]HET8601477.1 sulfite exporter TauE/SafE family protein [Segeticoccus sp.]
MSDLLTTASLSLLIVSFLVGIVVGLTGMGGGALMTPALILFGIPPAAAVSNDLVSSALTKSVGAAVHWKSGSPNLKLAGWLVAGSVPTGFAGAFIIRAVADTVGGVNTFIKLAIGATLLLTAGTYTLRMYLQMVKNQHDDAAPQPETDPPVKAIPTLLVGATGGLLVGLTSVGSGSLIMVAMVLLYPRLSPVRLVGTDLVQAIPLIVSAAISHWIVSGVDWAVLIPLTIGGAAGTFFGARIASWVSSSVIRRGIVLVLSLTGLTMLHVPPTWVGVIGAALVVLGPIGWGLVRKIHGLPPFETIAAPHTNGKGGGRHTDDPGKATASSTRGDGRP